MSDESPAPGVSRVPKFFDILGDPCEQNPFQAADPRHGIWRRATRRAQEELAKLAVLMPEAYNCHLQNECKRIESEISKYGQPVSSISMSPLLVPYYRAKFDAWAWRGLAAIASDADLAIYDAWVTKFASDWLELIERGDLPEEIKTPLINELHLSLQAGIVHWQSEARKHLRSQEEQSTEIHGRSGESAVAQLTAQLPANDAPQSSASQRHPAEDSPLPVERGPTEIIEGRAAKRQAVVTPILAKKRWKRGRLAIAAGVGKNSVYGYLNGKRAIISTENRTAIAHALDLQPDQLPE